MVCGVVVQQLQVPTKTRSIKLIAFHDLPRILKLSMVWGTRFGLSAYRHFESMVPNARKSGKGCIQDPLEFLTQLDTVLICSSGFRRSLNFMS